MNAPRVRYTCIFITLVLLLITVVTVFRLQQLEDESAALKLRLEELNDELSKALEPSMARSTSLGMLVAQRAYHPFPGTKRPRKDIDFLLGRTAGTGQDARWLREKRNADQVPDAAEDDARCRRNARSAITLQIMNKERVEGDAHQKCAGDSGVQYVGHSTIQCWGIRDEPSDPVQHCFFELLQDKTGLKIKKNGNYLITAQVTFLEHRPERESGRLTFAVKKGSTALTKCSSPKLHNKGGSRPAETCSTSIAATLERGDHLTLGLVGQETVHVHSSQVFTFISVAKL